MQIPYQFVGKRKKVLTWGAYALYCIHCRQGNNMNQAQLNAIENHLAKVGVYNYNVLQGNGCVWVSYYPVSMYFYFDTDNNIVDIIVD